MSKVVQVESAYKKCIELCEDNNRLQDGAKYAEEIGDICDENDLYLKAKEYYEKAADYCQIEKDPLLCDYVCVCVSVCVCVCVCVCLCV